MSTSHFCFLLSPSSLCRWDISWILQRHVPIGSFVNPAATVSPPTAMYSSSYSRAKFGHEAKEPLHRSRGKSCGYYMRIIFLFSSLIQSLIIVSLVLFLIYGQPEQSAEEKRVKVSVKTPPGASENVKNLCSEWKCQCDVVLKELEVGFNKLSENNIQLRKEKSELGAQLKARTAEKAAVEKELEKMKTDSNATEYGLKQKIVSTPRFQPRFRIS